MDQIGGGKSSKTTARYWNIETFVEELEILIDRWELNEFHLAGGSWGATLALEYYLRKKGKGVRTLVFVSPMFSAHDWMSDANRLIRGLPKKTRKVIEYCHEIGATDSKVYRDSMMTFYLKHLMRDKKKLEKYVKESSNINPHGNKVYEYMWGPSEFKATGTLKNYNGAKDLEKIKVPTLLACGEYDEATPESVERYHKMIEGSQFKILKGCSHASFHEKPMLVANVINTFLAKN